MGRKSDLRQVDSVATIFGMTAWQRREFGDFLEECKEAGDCGTANERGDFTLSQLHEKAREFLGRDE